MSKLREPSKRKRGALVAAPSQVALVVGVTPEAVRQWCVSQKVYARRTPGGEWRVEVDEQGWPLEVKQPR